MYTTAGDVRGLCKLITADVITDPEIEPFIQKAQVRIDQALRLRYRVPLSDPVPDIIKSIATDMAAAFILDKYYSDRSPDRTHLADVYMKRAEKDLEQVVREGTIDGQPGVVKNEPPAPTSRPAIATTTPQKSPLGEILAKW